MQSVGLEQLLLHVFASGTLGSTKLLSFITIFSLAVVACLIEYDKSLVDIFILFSFIFTAMRSTSGDIHA